MQKEKLVRIAKVCVPILLLLIAAVITISINLGVGVYPAKYYGNTGYIDFTTSNTYETDNNVGLYRYDDENNLVIFDETTAMERQSVFVLKNGDTKYISASAITWQVVGGLFYVAACGYMFKAYPAR